MKSPMVRAAVCVFSFPLINLIPSIVLAQYFEDATSGPLGDPGTSFGVAWGDCDRDGDLDLFFTKGSGQSKFLRNEGGASFVDISSVVTGGSGGDTGAIWADFDDDSDLDLFVANAVGPNRLVRNDGGNFVSIPAGAAAGNSLAQSCAVSDYDLDGDLDLFITHWSVPNKLLRNDGGTFVDVTPPVLAAAEKSTGAGWADYDNDHDPDLYVGGYVSGKLYRNDGGTNFVNVTTPALGKSGVNGVAWGDYDDDGDLDLYVAREVNSSRLLRNDSTPGTTNFTDMYIVAVRDPGVGVGCTWLDYDNDGDLDLVLAKAGWDNSQGDTKRLMRNNGGDSFTDVSSGPLLAVANSRGIAAGDYDGDGALDLYVANWGSPNQLLHNLVDWSRWLHIRLQGTDSNSYGIGARVRVKAMGKWQMREVSAGGGIYGMDAPLACFGFYYQTAGVDSIQVIWPSGAVTDTTGFALDQRIVIREGGQTAIGDDPAPVAARLLTAFPNPFRAGTTISYEVNETSPVTVLLVDPAGRLLRVLESADLKEPGRYQVGWDGRGPDGKPVAQGVYFYSLRAGDLRQSFPVVLVR